MLARRLVVVLFVLALAGIAVAGILVAVNSNGQFQLTTLRDVFLGTSSFLVIAGTVLGASFIGAEWHAGTLTTLLTWEPRRLRVFAAKLVAATVVIFLLAMFLQAVLGLVLAFVAALRGITEGTDAAWLRSVAGVALRSATLAAVAGAMGYAIAAVGRNTAAAIGVAFVYVAVAERLVAGLRPHWQRWLVGDNAGQFLTGENNRFPPLNRSMVGSGAVLAAYAAILLIAAFLVFRQRDVT